MSRSVQLVERFAPEAAALRAVFDERFADPRSTRGDRFVWDYWHVPGQYTHLRTPAWTYFPRSIYGALHQRLVAWGRETLGWVAGWLVMRSHTSEGRRSWESSPTISGRRLPFM